MTTGQEIRADAQAFAAVRKLFPGADRHVAGDIDKPAMFATVERAGSGSRPWSTPHRTRSQSPRTLPKR